MKKCEKVRKSAKNYETILPLSWEPVDHLQGSLGPSGPEIRKKSEKVSRGLRPGTPRESGKSPRKSLGKSLEGPERLFRDFFQTLGGSRPRETFFQTFPGFGPGGPERPPPLKLS